MSEEKRFDYNKRITFRKTPFILIMLISFLMVGVSELVKPTFKWETFITASYWYNVILANFSYILMAIGSCLMHADTLVSKDVSGEITKLSETLVDISPELQSNSVDRFLYEINNERKSKAWKTKINRKLLRLEKHAKAKNTRMFIEYVDTRNERLLKCRYVKRKIKLLEKLDELFIDENLDYLHVKYIKITRKLLTNGNFGNGDVDIPNKASVIMINGILPKFLISASFTTFMVSFGIDVATLSWVMVLPILIKSVSLLMNFVYGRNFAPQYVKETTIDNLYTRIRWVKRFTEWKKLDNTKDAEYIPF